MRIREATVADAAAMSRVHVDSWRTTYPGIVPDEHLASLDVKEREGRWRVILDAVSQDFTYVAESQEGEIVGFAGGGPESSGDSQYRGELYTIYLFEEYQRRGIGRQLTEAVVIRLVASGMRSMLTWVLTENFPARRFYEALGGRFVREQDITIGGASLVEVAYGWKDISVLIASSFHDSNSTGLQR